MTPAEELRAAATKFRETAKGVTHFPTPWTVEAAEDDQWRVMYVKGNPLAGLIATTPDYGRVWLADWIALMHPGLAEPLALMLDAEADRWETETGTWTVDCTGCSTGRPCSGEHVEARSHVGHCERLFQAPIDENRGADWRCDCFDPAIDAARAITGGGA